VTQLARTSQTYPILGYPEVRDVRDENTAFSAVVCTTPFAGLLSVSNPVWRALRADPANLLREQ
jgi:hypothetical protein